LWPLEYLRPPERSGFMRLQIQSQKGEGEQKGARSILVNAGRLSKSPASIEAQMHCSKRSVACAPRLAVGVDDFNPNGAAAYEIRAIWNPRRRRLMTNVAASPQTCEIANTTRMQRGLARLAYANFVTEAIKVLVL